MVPGAQYSATHGRRRDQNARHKRDPDPRHLCLHDAQRASRKVVFMIAISLVTLFPSVMRRLDRALRRDWSWWLRLYPRQPLACEGQITPLGTPPKGTQLQCEAAFLRLVLTFVDP